MTNRSAQEDGFTLIELLVSIVILGIIMSAISSAFIVFLRTSESALGRDDHSAGGALLASYLDRDLASADAVQVLTADDGSCSVAGASGLRLRLAWTERRATSPDDATIELGPHWRVSYARTGDLLIRKLCPPTGSPVETIVMSALPPLPASPLSISTSPNCGTAGTTRVVVSTPAFAGDSAQPYQYGGCVRGRTA